MRKTLVFVCVMAGLAAANPVVICLLNEISTDSAHQWVELHDATGNMGDTWLTGFLLQTSTSECTLSCYLPSDSYVIVDSQSLADHSIGNGTFRLDASSDFIFLIYPPSSYYECVWYPRFPTGWEWAPSPPPHSSISRWTDGFQGNWYVDSTPTPGAPNDDYSTISGWCRVDSFPNGYFLRVSASGQNFDTCEVSSFRDTTFRMSGLGAGRYRVWAELFDNHGGSRTHELPDSVAVGYNQEVSGVVIDLRSNAVAETSPPNSRLGFRADNDRLMIWLPEGTRVRLTVYNQVGRARARLTNGRLAAGMHSFALSGRLSPGVYFARLDLPGESRTAKVLIR